MNADSQKELIPMSPGDLLRHARETRGQSIEQVAQVIHVRPEVLRSIETGDTEQIPSVYLKGYIRSYARYVGVSHQSIEDCLPQARGAEPGVQSIFKEGLPRNRGDRWFKATSYVLASAVVIALAWQFTNEAVRFSQGGSLVQTSPYGGTMAPDPEEGAKNSVNLPAGSNPQLKASTHLKASIAPLEITRDPVNPAPVSGRAAEGAWAAMSSRNALAVPSPVGTPGEVDLGIATSADSWIEITDGKGNKVEMDLLRAGSSRQYHGTAPFRLLIGRASSVQLTYNGEPFDLSPHTRGNVARITLGIEAPTDEAEVADPPLGEEPAPDEETAQG